MTPDVLPHPLLRVREALSPDRIGDEIQIRAWVRTRRATKAGVTFLEVNDGSSLQNLQVVVPDALPNHDEIARLATSASVIVCGEVVQSPAAGQVSELRAQSVVVVGNADEYPLAKKRHSFEYLRGMAHLRPRTNTFGAVARVRNEVSWSIHRFFQERGFLYVQTPILTGSDAEGAGQMFQVTTLDLADLPKQDGLVDYGEDFFGRPTFLTVSGQLEAEIMATAFTNVYTFGPTFRAENSNTSRHLAEFWMIEPEIAFCDLTCLMDTAESFLRTVFSDVLEHCVADMEFFNERIQPGIIDALRHIVDTGFVRLSYTEAIEILERSGRTFEFPLYWGADLQAEHERYLTEEHFHAPVILSDYPASIKAFYMRLNPDGRTVAAMDVLVPGVGEIIGGSQREERYEVLMQRMRESGLDPEHYWWYLDLRRFGTVPHAGFGLGLERVVHFITGMQNIRDVIPFPRTPRNVEF